MTGRIYLKGDTGLLALDESAYNAEVELQVLLANYPDLLAGDQIDADIPRRWLLITAEAGIPDSLEGGSRWAVDHLFLDQDAIPTLVEVKRSTDTRIRREVVGQMLEYAANAVRYWPIEIIRGRFEARCEQTGIDPKTLLTDTFDQDIDYEGFWQKAAENLHDSHVRLLFVADEIPAELQRIIEFLNEKMDTVEVLGVSIKQYTGYNQQMLVPRVIGLTSEAQKRKSPGATDRQWDYDSFFAELEARRGSKICAVARRIYEWGEQNAEYIWWGKGRQSGSFFPMLKVGAGRHSIAVWTYGTVEIQFQHILGREEIKQELWRKYNALPGVNVPAESITKRPTIDLELLQDPTVFEKFISILDWQKAQIVGA